MGRPSRAEIMNCNIRNAITTFLNMTTEERIDYINRYPCLLPYEKTALLQCKKYMTSAEKKAYKQATTSALQCNAERQPE